MDKYDASKDIMKFIEWLVENNKARLLDGWENINIEHRNYDKYRGLQKNTEKKYKQLSQEEVLDRIRDNLGVDFKIEYEGKVYSLSQFEKIYYDFVEDLERNDEKSVPGTNIPRYVVPENGTYMRKMEDNNYVVVTREKIIREFSGENLFRRICFN